MHDAPSEVIESKAAGIADTRIFREFNTAKLASDKHGTPSWNSLIEDLVESIERIKPALILTPHMQLDPHSDHYFSTKALMQALAKTKHQPKDIHTYANHLIYSDIFPFGPVNTIASMPPNIGDSINLGSVISMPLTLEQQKNKAASLAMMHDLQTPLRWKKRIHFTLQSWFINRPLSPYGEDV